MGYEMRSSKYSLNVNLPDIEDFLGTYSRYTSLVNGDGKPLFEAIMWPEVFIRAAVISDIGLPAVLAAAEDCRLLVGQDNELSKKPFTKQFIGSVVCSLMEANGYKKTGTKRRVSHQSFSVGECYVRADQGGENE